MSIKANLAAYSQKSLGSRVRWSCQTYYSEEVIGNSRYICAAVYGVLVDFTDIADEIPKRRNHAGFPFPFFQRGPEKVAYDTKHYFCNHLAPMARFSSCFRARKVMGLVVAPAASFESVTEDRVLRR